jgi:hypothetical protein
MIWRPESGAAGDAPEDSHTKLPRMRAVAHAAVSRPRVCAVRDGRFTHVDSIARIGVWRSERLGGSKPAATVGPVPPPADQAQLSEYVPTAVGRRRKTHT